MGEVVIINQETFVGFIQRNGPTLTREVGYRFNLPHDDARRLMKDLEAKGLVKSRLVRDDFGRSYEWTAMRPR